MSFEGASKSTVHVLGSFDGTIRELRESDLESLKPILETWVRSRNTGELIPGEVVEDLQRMRESCQVGNDMTYFVAEEGGVVIGVIGMKPPSERMREFSTTGRPIELVNAYVAKDHRAGRGVGRALIAKLEEEARGRGYTEIILNSGPRYEHTGWIFYDKLTGFERIGIAVKLYGDDGDAPVWHKILKTTEDIQTTETTRQLEIKKATEADLSIVWGIIDECAQLLSRQGFHHWAKYYTQEMVKKMIQRKEVYLGVNNGRAIGSVTFDTIPPKYYAAAGYSEYFTNPLDSAVYVTALAVLPSEQNQGTAGRLLQFVEDTARNKNVCWLRIDCRAEVPGLISFYEKRGYIKVGSNAIDEGEDGTYWLMEKNLSTDFLSTRGEE